MRKPAENYRGGEQRDYGGRFIFQNVRHQNERATNCREREQNALRILRADLRNQNQAYDKRADDCAESIRGIDAADDAAGIFVRG